MIINKPITAEIEEIIYTSIRKWSPSKQDFIDMYVSCLEAYYCRVVGKEIDDNKLEGYLRITFSSVCIDFYRDKKKNSLISLDHLVINDLEEEPIEFSFDELGFKDVDFQLSYTRFLKALTDEDRKLILLLYNNLSYREIAEEIGSTLSAMSMKVHRARERWQQMDLSFLGLICIH